MNSDFKWLAQSTIYRDSIDMLAVIDYGNKERHVAQPVEFAVKKVDRNDPIYDPTIALSPKSARSLMQALWDAGIRPENDIDTKAEVAALKGHIAFAERVTDSLLSPKEQT